MGVIVLGFASALAQDASDPGLAAVQTGAGEKAVAGAARAVTRSAIGTVFGSTEPAAPGAAVVPAAVAPIAPVTGGVPAAGAPSANGAGTPPPDDGAEQAAAVALENRGRDPFRPFTLNLRPDTDESEILTPLQRFELPQLRLAGVVLNLRPPRAMLQDNSGMGYIITPGTPIGRRRGVVKSIEPRRIVVEELVLDYYGREQIHQVVIEMPKEMKPQNPGQE
jgi:hypothetical protein